MTEPCPVLTAVYHHLIVRKAIRQVPRQALPPGDLSTGKVTLFFEGIDAVDILIHKRWSPPPHYPQKSLLEIWASRSSPPTAEICTNWTFCKRYQFFFARLPLTHHHKLQRFLARITTCFLIGQNWPAKQRDLFMVRENITWSLSLISLVEHLVL